MGYLLLFLSQMQYSTRKLLDSMPYNLFKKHLQMMQPSWTILLNLDLINGFGLLVSTKHEKIAQEMISGGKVRYNGQRCKPSKTIELKMWR